MVNLTESINGLLIYGMNGLSKFKRSVEEPKLKKIKIIGTSGGALVAINVALDKPELVDCVVADSFEGLEANPKITKQIRIGRNLAKQNTDFCSIQKLMHGQNWINVFDANTEAIITHAKTVKSFTHKSIEELKVNMLLTGSHEVEMFPENHYIKLFRDICTKTNMAEQFIFAHGKHPAMMSNMEDFILLCNNFFTNLVIQNEKPEDYQEVENLARKAFCNVYKPGCSEHYVLHILRNHPDFIKELDFVMKLDNKIIGQIVFIKNHINDTPVLTMGPLCIHPDYQNKGYGRQLLEYGLNKAKALGFSAVFIEGDINFYAKSRSNFASKHNIKYAGLPNNVDSSFFLGKKLKPGNLKPGTYVTHPTYLVNDKDVEEFDMNFPKKVKLKLPSQIF